MNNWYNDDFSYDDYLELDDIDENGEFEIAIMLPYYGYPYVFIMPQEHQHRSMRQNTPPGPPPNFIPPKPQVQGPATSLQGGPSTLAIDPGQINFCLFKFTYIWQTNGRSYWAYLVRAGRNSIAGFRFRKGRWVYFGLDLRNIESFFCI